MLARSRGICARPPGARGFYRDLWIAIASAILLARALCNARSGGYFASVLCASRRRS